MKKLIPFIVLIVSMNSVAQSTLIEFNYHDETYNFYKITKKGDTIKKKQPFSYRNVPVKVVVKDLNTYQYNVTFDTQSFDEAPVGSEMNVETLLAGYATGVGAFNDLIGEVKENDIYQSLFKDGKFQGLSGITGAFGMGAAEFQDELELLEEDADRLKKINDDLVVASVKVDELFDYMTLVDFTNQELVKLLYNPNITHAEMKKRAELLAKEVFNGSIELNTVIAQSTDKAKVISNYRSLYANYASNSQSISSSINDLNTKLKTDATKNELSSFNKVITDRTRAVQNNYELLEQSSQDLTQAEIRRKLMEVYDNYDKIIHADFNYEYSLLTDRDVTQVTMRFGLNEFDSVGTIKTRIVNVPTHGGLRINTSAGMSFISYMGGQNSYLNDAGLIKEVKGDLFSPAITTMFHCYRQSYRPFTVGGSFGLSVPIEGQKDFIYMGGLSGIIGKKQRVIINVGGLGGKVERLSDGLKAGDALISEYSEVPTKRVFDFGFFVGVTFNINSLLGGGEAPSSTYSYSSSAGTNNLNNSGASTGTPAGGNTPATPGRLINVNQAGSAKQERSND
jgi:hypothetical protein